MQENYYQEKYNTVLEENEHISVSDDICRNDSETNKYLVDELQEVEIPLEQLSTNDSIYIRNKNSVYYEMYKEARRKARVARDLANSSYLEAKRIKNLYMLEETSDSEDSDFDNE